MIKMSGSIFLSLILTILCTKTFALLGIGFLFFFPFCSISLPFTVTVFFLSSYYFPAFGFPFKSSTGGMHWIVHSERKMVRYCVTSWLGLLLGIGYCLMVALVLLLFLIFFSLSVWVQSTGAFLWIGSRGLSRIGVSARAIGTRNCV